MEKAKEAIKKHGGLIKDKITGVHFFIITYSETKVVTILKPFSLQELFDNFVFFDDGTSCGECTED